jgi:hypothetical protein
METPLYPDLTCQHCGITAVPTVVTAGPHLKALCSSCNSYIKFIAQEKPRDEYTMFFGKHKGKTLCEIAQEPGGLDYLRWVAGATPTSDALRKAQRPIRQYLATIDKGIA